MVMVMKRQPLSPKWLIGFVTNSNVHLCPHCGDLKKVKCRKAECKAKEGS